MPKPVNSLIILNQNARSIRNKKDELVPFLPSYNIDITCITETFLDPPNPLKIPKCSIFAATIPLMKMAPLTSSKILFLISWFFTSNIFVLNPLSSKCFSAQIGVLSYPVIALQNSIFSDFYLLLFDIILYFNLLMHIYIYIYIYIYIILNKIKVCSIRNGICILTLYGTIINDCKPFKQHCPLTQATYFARWLLWFIIEIFENYQEREMRCY